MDGLDPSSLFTGGGLTALLAGVIYAAKLIVDALHERHETQRPGVTTAAMTDAVTANGVLINTLNDTRKTMADLERRLNEAQKTIDNLRETIELLREELATLRAQSA